MSEHNETSVLADDESASTADEETATTAKKAETQFEQEIAELKDQLLRQRAEFENFRRRVAKEKEELSEYASIETIRPLLAIVDDFERALSVECADANYATGMKLIHQRLVDTLKRIGVEELEVVGANFDPNLHHAIDLVKTADAPENTVLEALQKGYLFKEKLIRPAIVKVAAAPDGTE